MKGKGPKLERETIFLFNEAEPYASIWTASEPMYRKLLKLGYEPTEGSDRSALVKISMNLPPALWKRPRAKALQEDTTATEIIVRVIKEYLAAPQKKEKP